MVSAVLFIVLFGTIAIGMPIAWALGVASVAGLLKMGTLPMAVLAQKLFSGVDSFPMMAIPFFIFAGDLMAKGGLSTMLFEFGNILVGWIRGGLGLASVVASMIFGGISGSAIADCCALAPVEVPIMEKAGYDKAFATGLVCGSACIGAIIPPSIPMVLYAVATNVSIGGMFAAGMMPGIIIGVALMIVVYYMSVKRNYPRRTEKMPWSVLILKTMKAVPAIGMPVIILGGILFGIFTPTEAACVAVIYSFILSMFFYKDVKWSELPRMLANTGMISAVVLILASTSNIFGYIVTMEKVGPHLVTLFAGLNKFWFLLAVNLLLLWIGTFMDNAPPILILGPILAPLAVSLGVDPLHFGTIFIVNMVIGLITPPLGQVLFVAVPITRLKFEVVAKATMPFLIVEIVALLVITYVPITVMWLPRLLGYAH
ncbi:MAG: TRAP transporter large permease [Deltaproteobacteria bacterium]|nr:TRAP transporter large permease [Deltaproteobacteria bacterium]